MARAKKGNSRATKPQSSPRWLCVFELDDSAGQPTTTFGDRLLSSCRPSFERSSYAEVQL